ncbi:MAG: hypothetical protein AAGA03_13830 [Planctomycetota bacterium]
MRRHSMIRSVLIGSIFGVLTCTASDAAISVSLLFDASPPVTVTNAGAEIDFSLSAVSTERQEIIGFEIPVEFSPPAGLSVQELQQVESTIGFEGQVAPSGFFAEAIHRPDRRSIFFSFASNFGSVDVLEAGQPLSLGSGTILLGSNIPEGVYEFRAGSPIEFFDETDTLVNDVSLITNPLQVSVTAIPEPSMATCLVMAAGLAVIRRRR